MVVGLPPPTGIFEIATFFSEPIILCRLSSYGQPLRGKNKLRPVFIAAQSSSSKAWTDFLRDPRTSHGSMLLSQ